MIKKGQIKIKSRIPIPSQSRHITTAVPLSKLDNDQNKPKKSTTITSCSRMEYKKPISSSSSSSSLSPLTSNKMNKNTKPVVNRTATSKLPTKKETIPATAAPAKSNTKSLPTKAAALPKSTIPKQTSLRKSPITQLKENLNALKLQNQKDVSTINEQKLEITKLKLAIQNKSQATTENEECDAAQNELKSEQLRKAAIKQQIMSVNEEIKSLSVEVVDLLEVKNSINYLEEINKLQAQLEIQKSDFRIKLIEHEAIINAMDQRIITQQKTASEIKSKHTAHLEQLNSLHLDNINKIKKEHEQDMIKLKNNMLSKASLPKKSEANVMDDIIEQALIEFEQEQYNHHPPPPKVIQQDSNEKSLQGKILGSFKNQQWYSNNYMPVQAVSWPNPQPISNLKKLQR